MRVSTLAVLLMFTTLMMSLTACGKQEAAVVDDRGSQIFGRGMAPKYSNYYRAEQAPEVAQKYKSDNHQYGLDAEVEEVRSSDLPPPPAASSTPAPPALTKSPAPKALPAATSATLAKPMPTTTTSPAFFWPVKGRVVQSFGDGNEGITIAAPMGEPIRAAASGTVAYTGNAVSQFGNLVILQHESGFMSSYAHAKEILVSKGDRIRQGDILGYVGASGGVANPQLHFTIRRDNATVNPVNYLR